MRPDPVKVRRGAAGVSPAEGPSAVSEAGCSRTRISDTWTSSCCTGRTPMPCHALRASCFIDPWGVVYPCITLLEADRPAARHRHAARSDLECASRPRTLQREIWEGSARSAGPPARRTRAFSATSWPGGARSRRAMDPLPTRAGPSATSRAVTMNVTCFTDAVIQAHLDKAVARHVATDVSAVIAAKQEGAEHRRRHRADAPLRRRGRRRRRTLDRRHGRARRSEAARSVLEDGGRGKGEAIRRAIPHIRTPITVFLDADGSHDPEDIPLLVEPILAGRADHVSASRLEGGSSELHGGFDEFFRLAGSSFITACINWRFNCRLSDSQNGFRAIRTSVLRQLDLREDMTTIEQEMIIKTLRRGFRMAEVPSHEHPRASRRVAHPRVAQRSALRLLARQVSVLLTILFHRAAHTP